MRHQIMWGVIGLCMITVPMVGMEEYDAPPDAITPPPTAPVTPTATQPAVAKPLAPLAWQDKPQPEGKQDVQEGITTINEARGNWLFKAKILREARKLEDKIRKKVVALEPLQEKFLQERENLDRSLDAFYREYGFKSGEIEGALNEVMEQLKKLEQNVSPLDKEEKQMISEAKKRKNELEALKKDFDLLQKLENAISQGLATMSAQVTKANAYNEQAWESYTKIEDTLNDEAAEELLNKIQINLDNIIAIENYLTGDFRNFLSNSSQKLMGQIELVKKEINTLKDHGVALGKKMRELQEREAQTRADQEKSACDRQIKAKEDQQRTWFSPLFDAVSWVWRTLRDTVVGIYSTVTGWFYPKKAAQKVESVQVSVTEPMPLPTPEPVPSFVTPPQMPIDVAPQPPILPPVTIPEPTQPQEVQKPSEPQQPMVEQMPTQPTSAVVPPVVPETTSQVPELPIEAIPTPLPLEQLPPEQQPVMPPVQPATTAPTEAEAIII